MPVQHIYRTGHFEGQSFWIEHTLLVSTTGRPGLPRHGRRLRSPDPPPRAPKDLHSLVLAVHVGGGFGARLDLYIPGGFRARPPPEQQLSGVGRHARDGVLGAAINGVTVKHAI
eukprot:5738607-Pyramimonas_sp.AAC.1